MKNINEQPQSNTSLKTKMRKAKPKKRVILPDPVFNDQKVSKFVNHLMYDGKKSISYEIFYNALDTVKAKMSNEEKSALEIWKTALDNITPQVEVKSRRISIFERKKAVFIHYCKCDFGNVEGRAVCCSCKNDVFHFVGTEIFAFVFGKNPFHRINDIAFSTAVWTEQSSNSA